MAKRPVPVGGGRTFHGNGGEHLGTIRVPVASEMRWSSTGSIFQIYDDQGVEVNSQAHHGTSYLSPGDRTGVLVNTLGRWTITVTPEARVRSTSSSRACAPSPLTGASGGSTWGY